MNLFENKYGKWQAKATIIAVLQLGEHYGTEEKIKNRESLFDEIERAIKQLELPELEVTFSEIYTYSTDKKNRFLVDTCIFFDMDMGEYQGCESDVEKQVKADVEKRMSEVDISGLDMWFDDDLQIELT